LTIFYSNLSTLFKSRRQFKSTLYAEIYAAIFFILSLFILFFFPAFRAKAIQIELAVYSLTILFLIYKFYKFDYETLFKINGFFSYAKSIYKVGYMAILDGILWKLIPIYFINQKCTIIEKAVYLLIVLIGNAATLIPISFIESWTSEFADTYQKNVDNFLDIFSDKKKKIKYTILIIVPISVLGLSILMNTLYAKYISFLWLIILFVPLRISVSFFDIHSAALYATHNENKLILPSTLGALALTILSFFFSLHFGLSGILAAYIISKYCMALFTYRAFNKSFRIVRSKIQKV
jgi:O-antigen/teichoic acid export membrane protein